MKHIKTIIKSVCVAATVGLTSCSLDLMPLNEVVLENYWTDKNDVESVLNQCYSSMTSSDWMEHALIWGEIRSDNITTGPDVPTGLKNLLKGNLKQTNAACDWAAFYNTINLCNTVCYYAPIVAERDPNLTESDLRNYVAQAKMIRALNYFYLIRAFKDVPFSFQPSIDDNQYYTVAASKHEVILDSLIQDIEEVKDNVPRMYTDETTNTSLYNKNSGRVTRPAMYALLADMYLWRASDANLDPGTQRAYYEKAIENADYVIQFKYDQYENDPDHTLQQQMDSYVFSTYGYPLLAELSATGSSKAPAAYNKIFGEGNSWESIFEITYQNTASSSDPKNTLLVSMYGGYPSSGSYVQYLAASTTLMEAKIASGANTYSDNVLFPVKTDYRSLTGFRFMESGTYPILKYMVRQFQGEAADFGQATTSTWAVATDDNRNQTRRSESECTENWIIYRLSDMMLIRAEAEVEIAGIMDKQAAAAEEETPTEEGTEGAGGRRRIVKGNTLSTAQELYADAFNLVSAVYMRSNPNAQNTTTQYRPLKANYTTYDQYVTLVENERHREFLFEGKRYFDLVRRARREGNTSHFAQVVASKFGEASRSVLIKMAMMDFMYMPYLERQLDVNENLHQNPAYAEDEDIIKN